jgi:hypothetical protein
MAVRVEGAKVSMGAVVKRLEVGRAKFVGRGSSRRKLG